jgi:hypothetical protein
MLRAIYLPRSNCLSFWIDLTLDCSYTWIIYLLFMASSMLFVLSIIGF